MYYLNLPVILGLNDMLQPLMLSCSDSCVNTAIRKALNGVPLNPRM